MTPEPVAVPGLEIPSWVPEAHRKSLNGGSAHRAAIRAKFTEPGDGVCGRVMLLRDTHAIGGRRGERTAVAVLRVEAGQLQGQPVQRDEWVEVFFTARDLVTFYERHEPREGDTLSILYGGEVESGFGLPRKSFACGIERGNAPELDAETVKAEAPEPRW